MVGECLQVSVTFIESVLMVICFSGFVRALQVSLSADKSISLCREAGGTQSEV